MTDYRKQKIKEGVYTLRLAYQPADGDHMGTAPNNEFCLPVAADDDKDAALMKPKALQETSAKVAGGNHPAVLLLFPPAAKAPDAAKLEKDDDERLGADANRRDQGRRGEGEDRPDADAGRRFDRGVIDWRAGSRQRAVTNNTGVTRPRSPASGSLRQAVHVFGSQFAVEDGRLEALELRVR